jgi:hypothetical protein
MEHSLAKASWLTPLLVLVLVLAGCSSAEERPTPPTPPPPATRALVIWSETICTQVQQIDQLRGEFAELEKELAPSPGASPGVDPILGSRAGGYVDTVVRSVDSVNKTLNELTPSGVPAAEAHVAGLVEQVGQARAQLPPEEEAPRTSVPDEEQIAEAKRIGAVIAKIEPQGPKLVALVEGTPALISSYNLAPSCTPLKQHDERVRTLVAWSTAMCNTTESLLALDTDPLASPELTDPRFAQFAGHTLANYISSAARSVNQVAEHLGSLPPTGVAGADEYQSRILTAVQAATQKLPKHEGDLHMRGSRPIGELKTEAAEVAKTLKSIKPKEADLPSAVATDPGLLAAYNLAPACEPPTSASTELPKAADGTNVAACRSGKCQIQVNGSADVAVSGFKFKISVTPSRVNVSHDSGLLTLGSGGEGSFGNRDKTVKLKVLGLRGNTAVLDISTS